MNAKISLPTLVLILLCLSSFSRAQELARFSLNEALDYAMTHSYAISNARHDVESARSKVWETITLGLPQISGSGSYTDNLKMPVSLIPAEFLGGEPGTYVSVSFGQKFSSNIGLSVDQLIFDGSYLVGINSSKIYLQMATQTREKTEIEVRNAIRQSYFLTLLAEENLKVMQENLESSKKLLGDTKAMYESGFLEEQDQDQMKLLVQNGENQVLKAEREIRIAKMVLKYTMGFDVEGEIILTDRLEQYVAPLIAAGNHNNGFSFTDHIDYRMADTHRQLTEKSLNLEKVAYLPRLTAFYNLNKTSFGNNWNLFTSSVSWHPSSMIGLNLSVPIFDFGMKQSRIRQANHELAQAQNNQQQTVQALRKDYLTAIADLETAIAQYKNDEDNKMLARKIYEKATIKYNHGITGSTELTQIESQYIQSQGAYVAAVMQLLTAKTNLDKAIGKL